jgi:hypothetical protein
MTMASPSSTTTAAKEPVPDSSSKVNVSIKSVEDNESANSQISPTSVVTETATALTTTSNADKHDHDDKDTNKDLIQRSIDATTALVLRIKTEVIALQQHELIVDRKTVTTGLLSVVCVSLCFLVMSFCFVGGIALLFSPLWLPLVVITSPFWVPLLVLTCPLWLTSLVLVGGFFLVSTTVLSAIVLFFVWPAEWLPTDNDTSKWFLQKRDASTMALVKLQAKLMLYAAGVGPLADAAFLVLDKVDIGALLTTLQEIDVVKLTSQLQNMEFHEIQAAILQALWSLVK